MRLIAYTLLAAALLVREGYPAEPEGIAALKLVLANHSKEPDIGRACLTMARDVYPQLDIAKCDETIEVMVHRISYLARGILDPERRIGLLNTYFFQPGWWNDSLTYAYDLDDLEARQLDNRYLNGYLSTRKGSCITMSMLYLVVTDRLGWRVAPVRAAKHVFCRYLSRISKQQY
jgi:regulator of sirC expression with transglutaminase-like and TPR domain